MASIKRAGILCAPGRAGWKLLLLLLLLLLLGPGTMARADFRLPILNPVPKTLSIPASCDPAILARFSRVEDIAIEVRPAGGNLVPRRLLRVLKERFSSNRKIFIMQGNIMPQHSQSLSGLEHVEVWYRLGTKRVTAGTKNQLYSLGPVRKIIVLPADFDNDTLQQVLDISYTSLALAVGQSIPEQQLRWLSWDRRHRKYLLLSPVAGFQAIYQASELHPVELLVPTRNNRLDDKLLRLLDNLRGMGITIVVDGRFTIADARLLSRLENFSLKVVLQDPPRFIPGLADLLGRLHPP